MNNISLWRFIHERLMQSHSVILLCVVDSQGSSPGRKGFKMAVAADGLSGSIGGGIMEHKFAEMAKEKLRSLPDDPVIRRQIHSKSATKNQSGMICSGEQTIMLFHLTKVHADVIGKIISSMEKNQNGKITISPNDISFVMNAAIPVSPGTFSMNSVDEWKYEETMGYSNHLYIVGGGHCALALSRLMSNMDFYIHLYEERKELNTFEQNAYAHEKIIVEDYSTLKGVVPSGKNIYAVIMTFGYRTDDIALRSLIYNDFAYLGVLGSRSKMDKMFEEWRRDKLPSEKLNNIFAPVGIRINSHTPEEIAVSIAAEIISVKNKVVF